MLKPTTPRAESKWRCYFRRCRIAFLLALFTVIGALLYLNLVGLPDFLRRPLLEKLRERGLDLQIATLRWHFFRGIVAENVKFGRMGDVAGPRFTAREAELEFNYRALLRRKIEITSVGLRDGMVTLPVGGTNEPGLGPWSNANQPGSSGPTPYSTGRVLAVEKIRVDLRLLPDDAWSLEDFHAGFAGADFFLTGAITNASAVADWPVFASGPSAKRKPGAFQRRLKIFAETLERIRFAQTPEIRAVFSGDARDLESFALRLTVSAPDADTPWGRFADGSLTVSLKPKVHSPQSTVHTGAEGQGGRGAEGGISSAPFPRDSGLGTLDFRLEATSVQTPWAEVSHPHLELRMVASESDTNLVNASLDARAEVVNTRWVAVTNAHFIAAWTHSARGVESWATPAGWVGITPRAELTNRIPLSGSGELKSDAVGTGLQWPSPPSTHKSSPGEGGGREGGEGQINWAAARSVGLKVTLGTLANPPPADAALGPWQWIQPYVLGWSLQSSRFDTDKLGAEEVSCSGLWSAPLLEVTNLVVRFPEGGLEARARLDVESREATFDMQSDFDIHQAAPLLTEKAARWLARYSWAKPPHLAGSGAVILPAWTNRQPDWRVEVAPTLRLAAYVTATNCAYLKIPADWVRTHVSYTNQVWRLPDLVAARPEGTLELAHIANDRLHEFWFGFRSTISPEVLRPLLSTNAQLGLDYFQFGAPPAVEGGVWGRWRDAASIGFTGRVALADFTFREQAMSRLTSELRYTNRFLEFLGPRLERGSQTARGAGVAADFDARRIYFTNLLSTTEPLVITRCIGPNTTEALKPYAFHKPPTVRVNGFAPLGRSREADLIFDVDGGPFTWRQFHIPHIAGRVHWLNEGLTLSNVRMQAYGGEGAGQASFDLGLTEGTAFQFTVGVTNVDLKSLMLDLATRTNQLEGRLDGVLVVAHANSTNAFTWNGHGHAGLRDGLIWAIPFFGVLSKPLDTVMPGLGSARISEGTATFSITNGVVFSNNLEMRAPTTRLQYVGTVDFAGQVNARVRAEPLRDTWVIGPLLRLALWPVSKVLEYKMTGTLAEPQPEPLYIPRLIYKPLLHPFQTLEDIFTPNAGGTPAPPQFSPVPE